MRRYHLKAAIRHIESGTSFIHFFIIYSGIQSNFFNRAYWDCHIFVLILRLNIRADVQARKRTNPPNCMLLSMTGFGKACAEIAGKKITVEIKSLNSKQFDLNARVPSVYRSVELDLRNMIAATLQRGKVDLNISAENTASTAGANLNIAVLESYLQQITAASEKLGIKESGDWWPLLLRMPDVYASDGDGELSETEASQLSTLVGEAVQALMNYRRTEGQKLEDFFAVRISNITALLAEVPRFETARIDRIRQRLADGLAKIPVADYDKGRLEQEMFFYIEKLDVNEEKQRLAQHLAYFTETMQSIEPGRGKKLGFIAQEMGREINTLGSKSNDAEMQKLVVLMKDNLEQIKEQVLNVM